MAVVLALPLYAVLCLALWAEPRWQPDWDGALTILTARNLAEGQGYSYLGQPFILRPPGLAWLLSHLQGVGRFDAAPLNLAIMGFAGAWIAALYYALRSESSRARALAIALLTGTSALAVERFNRIESEFPFAAALFLCFGLHERAQQRARTALAALAGLALAASLYLRSAGLVLMPGFLLLSLLPSAARPRWRAWLPVLLALALAAPWLLWAGRMADRVERPAEQLLLFDYRTAIFHSDAGDPESPFVTPAGWLARAASNTPLLLEDLARTTLGSAHPLAQLAIAPLVAVGFALRLRRGPRLLDWWAAAYAGVLIFYFTHHPRLALPLLPVAYACALEAAAALGPRLRALRRAPAAPVTVLAGSFALVNVLCWPTAPDPDREWAAAYQVAERVRRTLPRDALLMADNGPVFAVLTQRRTLSFRHARDGQNLLDRYDPELLILNFEHPSIEDAKAQVFGAKEKLWKPSPRFTLKPIQSYEPHPLPLVSR